MIKLKFILLILFARIKHRVMWHFPHYRREYEIRTAINFGMEMDRLHRLAESKDIGVDFREAIYQMRSEEYENNICCGAFTQPSELKAHLYFANIRRWINIERARYNKYVIDEGLANDDKYAIIPPLANSEPITFGVMDSEDNLYLIGKEWRDGFVVNVVKDMNTQP